MTDNLRRVFTLSTEDLASLEKLRSAMGLRSHAAVVRELIGRAAKADTPASAGGDPEAEAFIADRRAGIAQGARGVRRRADPAPKPWAGGHPKPGKAKP